MTFVDTPRRGIFVKLLKTKLFGCWANKIIGYNYDPSIEESFWEQFTTLVFLPLMTKPVSHGLKYFEVSIRNLKDKSNGEEEK